MGTWLLSLPVWSMSAVILLQIILAIFSTAVGMAVILLASHSRPFTGEISVRPTVLLQVMPEGAPPGPAP
jgi:hypothetical protein